MRPLYKLALAMLVAVTTELAAQDLAPRAYVITPVRANALTLTYSFYRGELLFGGAVPITDSTGTYHVPILSYYHSFSFLGRSANFTASLPYAVGKFKGNVRGEEQEVYRSGLADSYYRLSVNLKGGPAMHVADFQKWHQKTLIGMSLKIVAPTGQYDRSTLINWGSNRWAFKPEVGLSKRWGSWILDTYGAIWFFTANPHFFERRDVLQGTHKQTQKPTGAFEGHLSYDVKPRLWVSLDGNYWFGGRTSVNGIENPNTLQQNSRIGFTASAPISKHQSLKFSYSRGAFIKFGGKYQNLSIGWQYSWIGKPL